MAKTYSGKTSYSTNSTDKTGYPPVEEKKLIISFTLYKSQLEMDQISYLKPKTLKLQEENRMNAQQECSQTNEQQQSLTAQ